MRTALDDVLRSLRGGGAGGEQPGAASTIAVDFSDRNHAWQSVDDRVMGGSSRSRMVVGADGVASFEGELVVANGGFASVRMIPRERLALAGAKALLLRCEGDGRTGYKLSLKTDAAMDGVSYQLGFNAGAAGAETVVRLPLSSFKASFRGQLVRDAPKLRGEDVVQLGVMLSRFDAGSGPDARVKPGKFQLRLVSIEVER